MNKIYIIEFASGQYEDFRESPLFAVKTEEEARKYVEIFKLWREESWNNRPEEPESHEDNNIWLEKHEKSNKYFDELVPPMGLATLKEDWPYGNDGVVRYYELEVK